MSLLTKITDVDWQPQRQIVTNASPFSGATQRGQLRFNRWAFLVNYAKTKGDDARAKISALMALKGGLESFDFRDPSLSEPSSGYSGAQGTINSSATGYTIPVKGLATNTLIANAGDFMSVQSGGKWQLFSIASNTSSDGAGDAVFTVNNPVRGSFADDDAVRFSDWLVTVTIEDNEKWRFNKSDVLELPPLRFIEDF